AAEQHSPSEGHRVVHVKEGVQGGQEAQRVSGVDRGPGQDVAPGGGAVAGQHAAAGAEQSYGRNPGDRSGVRGGPPAQPQGGCRYDVTTPHPR
ncbi:unnamed protein product, partial [Ectocarpus sp. 12 AP-2014]